MPFRDDQPRISVKGLLLQAFLTGWEKSGKAIPQDEYLDSSIRVIEKLQVEPETLYAEEGLGLLDGDHVDHLEDLLRADGAWLYYGVEAENFFLLQWYPDQASAQAKLADLEALGDPAPRKPFTSGIFWGFIPGAAAFLTAVRGLS